MDIILLEKIEKVGGIGDRVKVKSGYARNYLLPKGKATLATPENIAKFDEIRAELERKASEEVNAAKARADQLAGKTVRIAARAGTEGKLFGSIGTIDLQRSCKELGVEVERSEIRMPDGPIRVVGEYQVEIHFHTDVSLPLHIVVESSETAEPVSIEETESEE